MIPGVPIVLSIDEDFEVAAASNGPHIIGDTTIQNQGRLEHLEILAVHDVDCDVGVEG